MKVAAIVLSSVTVNSDFLSRHIREVATTLAPSSGNDLIDYDDYPTEGQEFLDTINGQQPRSGRGSGASGTRKIYARKRLINSQIATADRSSWYYHYHDYGCYCVAPTDEKKNRGKPVDAVDSVCKKHALCYSCAFSDYSSEKGAECNPKQMGYKYNIREGDNGKYHISCLNQRDTCAYAACLCDKALAEELGTLAMNGIIASTEYRNYDGAKCSSQAQRELFSGPNAGGRGDTAMSAGGSVDGVPSFFHDDMSTAMDFENEMQIMWGSNGDGSDAKSDIGFKQCCGVYPQRFPYKAGRNHECCDVGKSTEELKPVGTC